MQITHFGHACVLLDADSARVHVDRVDADQVAALGAPVLRAGAAPITFEEVPRPGR